MEFDFTYVTYRSLISITLVLCQLVIALITIAFYFREGIFAIRKTAPMIVGLGIAAVIGPLIYDLFKGEYLPVETTSNLILVGVFSWFSWLLLRKR